MRSPHLVGWEREGPNHVLLEALTRNVGPHPGRAHRHELGGVAVRFFGGLNERVGVVDLRLTKRNSARGKKRMKQCIRMKKNTHVFHECRREGTGRF